MQDQRHTHRTSQQEAQRQQLRAALVAAAIGILSLSLQAWWAPRAAPPPPAEAAPTLAMCR